MAPKDKKSQKNPIPPADQRERVMAKSLLKGYRQWVREGMPNRNSSK